MNRSRVVLIFFFFVVACNLGAQNVSLDEHKLKISSLGEKEQIDYILENYYALYSIDFNVALQYMKEATELAHSNGWREKEAYGRMYQGIIFYLKGDYENTLPQYLRSHQIFDSLKHLEGLARVSNEMAIFYGKQKDYKNLYRYLDEALQLSETTNNRKQFANSLSIKATYLEREGKVDEAEPLYQKIYDIMVEEGDSLSISYAVLDLSNMALQKGNLPKALAYIERSTAIRKSLNDTQGVVINIINTGEAYLFMKDYKKAIPYFEQCLREAIPLGYTDLVRYTYDKLAAANLSLDDYKSAYHYQQKSQAYKDSLFNIEKAKAIAEVHTRYETEKKEQQLKVQELLLAEQEAVLEQRNIVIISLGIIVLLIAIIFIQARVRYKRQQELMRKEHELSVRELYIKASIESQETERKRFAQDLHDGMGQLISAVRLALVSVDKNTSLEERVEIVAKAENLLNDMHKEIRSIAFNLMPQTLVQNGLVSALREMAERVNHAGKIVVRVNAFDMPPRLEEVMEISLYRIIQEWVNNVVKYAQPTIIEVQLMGYDTEVNVTIEDNGKGFDVAVLKTGKGNGWNNIMSRLNLIKAEIEIDSRPGQQGTTMIIKIPVRATTVDIDETVVINTR